MTDHSAEDRTQKALPLIRKERDRFAALSFCWADAVLELDRQGRIVYCAGIGETVFGAPADTLIGGALADRIDVDDESAFNTLLADPPPRGRVVDPAVRLVGTDGRVRIAALCGFRLRDLDGHTFVALRSAPPPGGVRDGAGAKAADEYDAASGLPNAETFTDALTTRLAAGAPESDLSLLFISQYDTLHRRLGSAGERELAAALGACLRGAAADDQSAGRLGPDRYGLIHTRDFDLRAIEHRLSEIIRQRDPTAASAGVQTATIAIDTTASDAASQAEIANGLLYTLNRFRNCKGSEFTLKSLSGNITTLAREACDAVRAFKNVTANADFDVLFQPIVDACSGVIHHYEALARFTTICGTESPYEQITFAEETGLIADFDLAMTKKVIDWLSRANPLNGKIQVAVNLSGQSIGSVACLAALDALLRDNAWARGRLMFEITESAHLGNLVAANAFVQRLRRQGFPVCLDDFGAGAANFEYLSSLEIDIVKLDGAAIRGARTAHKGKAFLKALVSLCRDLGVLTVAEMIEDEAALTFVRDCGVHYVQGYLFGKPARDIATFRHAIPARLFPAMAIRTGGGSLGRRLVVGHRA